MPLNIPNTLTWARIVMIPIFVGIFYLPDALMPIASKNLVATLIFVAAAVTDWFDGFLPDAARGRPETLFTPATVSDRSDGKIAHLDGLNLSRAWCWRAIAAALGPAHPVAPVAEAAAQHYFKKSASQLNTTEAARLAVMLPAPKRFEKTPGSAYLAGRTRTILGRMGSAELP